MHGLCCEDTYLVGTYVQLNTYVEGGLEFGAFAVPPISAHTEAYSKVRPVAALTWRELVGTGLPRSVAPRG